MSCYGKSQSSAADLSRTLWDRMIAIGEMEKEGKGKEI